MKLAVEISDAADLAPKDAAGSCNPFVEVEFDDQKQRTATKPADRSPYWNHTLLFDVRDPDRLPSLPIDVTVHHDRRLQDHHAVRPHTFLGRVRISGASVAPSPAEAVLQRYPLEKRGLFSRVSGDIALRVYLIAHHREPSAAAAAAADTVSQQQPPEPVAASADPDRIVRSAFAAAAAQTEGYAAAAAASAPAPAAESKGKSNHEPRVFRSVPAARPDGGHAATRRPRPRAAAAGRGVRAGGDEASPAREARAARGRDGEDGVDVRHGGADVVPVRERGEGAGPADDGHHGGAGPVRGGEAGQLQGRHQAPGEEPQPGVAAGVRLLPRAPPGQPARGRRQGQGRPQGRLRRPRPLRHDRHPPPRPPRQPARAAVVPPRRPPRREAAPRRDHARRLDRHPGRRGLPGGLALGRALRPPRGPHQHALQGVLLPQARLPQGRRHLRAGPRPRREGPPAGAHHRQDTARRPDPADAPGAAAGVGQPGVERGVHVRRRGAVRRAAGGDGRGARGPRAGRAAGPRDHPGGGAVRAPQRPGQVGGVQVVQPVARAVGGRGGGGRHGQEEGAQDVREQDPPAAEPGDGVPRAGRVDALQQRPAAVREEAAQGRHRGPGPGHPERARPGAHEGQAGGPDGPLLRGQVRRQVGAHAHAAQHARAAVERAVHLGRVRPLHRPHRGRLRQLPRRRRRRRRQGPEDRQGAHPPLDAGDRPRVHALLPADGAQPVGPEEDGGPPPGRPLHLHRLGQHAHHVRQAAAPQDALHQPHFRAADGLPPVPGHADGGDAAGPRGAAAAEGGGGVHAGRGLAHVQPAAEQGQLLPDHVALLGRGGGGQVVRRHLQVEEPADDDPGARAVPDPGVLPGADPAHRLPLPLHDRAVELPPAAAQAHAHGHGAVARRAGAPGRAGRGVRHVPDLQAGGGRADEVRPAAERGRAGADGGGRPGDAGGARAVAAELARPQGDGHLHHAGAHRGRGALRHAVPGGGRRGGAVPPPAPAVPEQAAVRAIQLLQAPARQVRHAAMNPYCHTATILPYCRSIAASCCCCCCESSISVQQSSKVENTWSQGKGLLLLLLLLLPGSSIFYHHCCSVGRGFSSFLLLCLVTRKTFSRSFAALAAAAAAAAITRGGGMQWN